MKVRQILNNSKISPHQKINYIKTELSPGSFEKFFRNNTPLKNFLKSQALIREIKNVSLNEPYVFTQDFEKEFLWITNKLLLNINSIVDFSTCVSTFNQALLTENFDEAHKTLDYIQHSYGYSLWLLESRLHLTENELGTSSNWKLLSEYLSLTNNPIYNFCINSSSKKIETNLPFESFVNQFQNDLNTMNVFGFLNDFLVFRNFKLAQFEYNFNDLSSVLYVSNIFSIIDQYLVLIEVILYHISVHNEKYFSLFEDFLIKLHRAGCNDNRIPNILNIISVGTQLIQYPENDIIQNILEEYYRGNFAESKVLSCKAISSNVIDFEVWEIYVKSLINLALPFEDTGMRSIDYILLNIYQFMQFNSESEKASKALAKLSVKYSNVYIGFHIAALLYEIERNNNLNISLYCSSSHNSLKLLLSPVYHKNILPKYVPFNTLNYSRYKSVLYNFPHDSPYDYYTADNKFILRGDITTAYREEHYSRCISLINESNILHSSPNYFKEITTFYLYESLIKEKKITDAIVLFYDIYFDENIYYYKINYKNLYDVVFQDSDKYAYLNNCNALILGSLFNSEYDLYELLDEYLYKNNIEFNDLDSLLHKLDINQCIYVLFKIYTIDTLKYFFSNIQDVEEFRLKVLIKLISIDIANKIHYEAEKNEIEKNLSVRNVIQEVNDARLFVDVPKLKEILVEKYTDDFNRFWNIVQEKKATKLSGFNSSRKRNWEKSLKESADNTLDKYDDADFIAFKNIYYFVRQNFLFSKEYGLDSCLSTRIRHGALKNQLRSVFDSLNLLTSKNGADYIDNLFWSNIIEDVQVNLEVQTLIKELSNRVDSLNDFVVNEVIQINHENNLSKKNGLFNYYTTDEILYEFYSEYVNYLNTAGDSIDTLLNDLILFTNFTLRDNLVSYFTITLFEKYRDIVLETIDKISKLSLPPTIYLIENLNKSITDVKICLDEVSNWFFLNTSSSANLLMIEDIINASFVMTQRLYNNYTITSKINISFDQVAGYASLIYVFNILFSNCIVHSNLAGNILITVDVDLVDNKFVKIDISNNFNNLDIKKVTTNLEAIKKNWKDFSNIDRSNVEGQSGFDKIKRIMIYEAKCVTDHFDYLITDNTVTVSLFLIYNKPSDEESINN
ncbi:hypothetical protein Q73A0000_07825 [Kaistella flava (ex Peng et al. 2021)]|uniref:Uncharacterized protein n=1 Tax=Kaistella flava (ex Peng et al. 2021) TaxID=2038776 RepID=A0A7M2Y804_9FLAO|nr:hypothetical protein [Kaistella flava (ex Peng et al. 2021)]QOW10281.1 hypothetical protein Q73A0000_07825 [Kaistella flava (ex Peng et al. 2021)]